MYAPALVTPPSANDPITTLAEAMLHCSVDSSDWDSLITGLIAAATAHLDGWSGILGRRRDADLAAGLRCVLPTPSAAR